MKNVLGMRGEGPIPADQQDEGRGRPNPRGYLYIYPIIYFGSQIGGSVDIGSCEGK